MVFDFCGKSEKCKVVWDVSTSYKRKEKENKCLAKEKKQRKIQ